MDRKLTVILAAIIALLVLSGLVVGLDRRRTRADGPSMEREQWVGNTTITVTVVGVHEQFQVQPLLAEFSNQTGFATAYEQTEDPSRLRDCEASGNCPDVALVPWPRLLTELSDDGALVDLSTLVSSTVLNANYGEAWIDLGSVDGTLYGVWFDASNKSLVWHDPTEFSANGWSTPDNWAELIALSDQILGDTGTPPWSIGNESGYATGWPLTDWFEDILLRSAGPQVYDDLVAHDIPWTHPAVISAMVTFGDIFGNEAYQLGGKEGTLNTNVFDAAGPPFEHPPRAYLHRQASFAQGWIAGGFPDQTAGLDYAVFPFPDIDPAYGNAVLIGGGLAMAFNASAGTQALVDFLISTDTAELWIGQGNMSPNRSADLDLYPDPNTRAAAELLANADLARFDLTDQVSGDLNEYVWSQMDDLVRAAPDEDATEAVLRRIEWKASGTLGEAFLPLVLKGHSSVPPPANRPPHSPSSPWPADGATDQRLDANPSWTGGDPDGDSVTYDVHFEADDATPDALICSDSAAAFCDPGTLDYDTHYSWKVVARDEHGATTTGPVWDFTTLSGPNSPPNAPSSPVPADWASGQNVNVNLSWSGGDPDGDSVTYDVTLGADDSTPDRLICDDAPSAFCDPGPLECGRHYSWTVVATDEHGASTMGPVWGFSTQAAPIEQLSFQEVYTYDLGEFWCGDSVAVADFDRDGLTDIVLLATTSYESEPPWHHISKAVLLHNEGSWQFSDSTIFEYPENHYGWDVQAADLNNDGWADLVLGEGWDTHVFLNDQSGGFSEVWAGSEGLGGLALADVSNDGFTDLLCGIQTVDGGVIEVYRNNGSGTDFEKTWESSKYGGQYGTIHDVVAADLNGDSAPDIVATEIYSGLLVSFSGDGTGTSFLPWAVRNLGDRTFSLAVGNVNGDSLSDLAVGVGWGQVRVFLSEGDFSATEYWVSPDIGVARRLALQDFDLDGYDDLFAGTSGGGLRIYRNLPGSGFELLWNETLPGPNDAGTVAHLDGDCYPDLIVGEQDSNEQSTIRIWRHTGGVVAAPNAWSGR